MSAEYELRLDLNQMIGDFVGHFPCVFFVKTVVNAAVGDEAVIFEIETIERHCER